jgi:ribosomal protein S18 acetylase RimI-like enzyme
MSDIHYRNATQEDIPQMLALWRCFWKPQAYEANLHRKIAKDADLVVVAERKGKIVGTIIGRWDGWWAWVYRVAVHPDCQRQGIAAGLFKEIHARLAARGADAACLFAAPDNAPMCALLDKLGYTERHGRRFSYLLKAGNLDGL